MLKQNNLCGLVRDDFDIAEGMCACGEPGYEHPESCAACGNAPILPGPANSDYCDKCGWRTEQEALGG